MFKKIVKGILFCSSLLILILLSNGCLNSKNGNPVLTASLGTAADDFIYFSDVTGQIHALQANDGTELWQHSITDDLAENGQKPDVRIDRLFARSGGKVFGLASEITGSNAGETVLFALNGKKLLWLKNLPQPEPNGSSVALGNNAVYFSGNDGILSAFSQNEGQLLWQYQVSQGTIGAPIIGADGTIYVTGARNNLHAVNENGEQRWISKIAY